MLESKISEKYIFEHYNDIKIPDLLLPYIIINIIFLALILLYLYIQITSSSSENELEKPKPTNKPLMIIGPSGVGKDSIMSRFKEKYPNLIDKCVSNTTRAKRNGEIEGENYYYISKEKFEELESKNELIGVFKQYGNCYGFSKTVLKKRLSKDKIIYLDFNITTAEETAKDSNLDINYIALLPPSIDILKDRLVKRNTEDPEKLQKRLEFAPIEIERIKAAKFLNFTIVNDNFEKTFEKFEECVKSLYSNILE